MLNGARYALVAAAAVDTRSPLLYLYDRRGTVLVCDFTWPASCTEHLALDLAAPPLSALAEVPSAPGVLLGCGPSGLFELRAASGARQLLATAGNCTALASSHGNSWCAGADARALFLFYLASRLVVDVLARTGDSLFDSLDGHSRRVAQASGRCLTAATGTSPRLSSRSPSRRTLPLSSLWQGKRLGGLGGEEGGGKAKRQSQ